MTFPNEIKTIIAKAILLGESKNRDIPIEEYHIQQDTLADQLQWAIRQLTESEQIEIIKLFEKILRS